MKVTLYMAMSLDGMVADEKGEEDFLSHENWVEFSKFAHQKGANIWGHKTYEAVKKWNDDSLKDLDDIVKIIISQDTSLILDDGFTLADSPEDALTKLEKLGLTETVLSGGPNLNNAFIKAGLVNEYQIMVNPIILGKGRALFDDSNNTVHLKLIETKTFENGLVLLKYRPND